MDNNSSNIVLSICLATYNQTDKVKRFFESIIPQLNPKINQQIEIVVRDDSTNSETENLIKYYIEKNFVSIRYFRGKKEGLDVAIIFLTKKSIGNYVWWFGDDALDLGAINYILDIIKKYPNLSLIYVNSRNINDSYSVAFNINKDKFFKDKNQILEEIAGNLGYITATIFKKDEAVLYLESAKKFIGSAWVNLYIILSVIANGNKFYFVSFPYVMGDPKLPDQPSWYDGFWVFAINFWHIIDAIKEKFDKHSINYILNNNVWKICRGILVYRAKDYKTGLGSPMANLQNLIFFYWKYPKFWLAAPFLLMPRFMIKFLYMAYKKLF